MPKNLIFGNGWVGNKFARYLGDAVVSPANITDRVACEQAIEQYYPKTVINCAGKTGRPNIDWCESHKLETYLSNVEGPMALASACRNKKVSFVHISSGCVYEGDNNGHGFSEKDTPNYFGSFYSRTKIAAENYLKQYNVLQLRLRMPVDKEPHDRNLITKLIKYERVISVPNSLSVIDDFLFAGRQLIEKECTGIYNVVNPGIMTHGQLLQLYQEIVEPSFRFMTFSVAELLKIIKTGRSNCVLNTDKLQREGIYLAPIKEAVKTCLDEYKKRITL